MTVQTKSPEIPQQAIEVSGALDMEQLFRVQDSLEGKLPETTSDIFSDTVVSPLGGLAARYIERELKGDVSLRILINHALQFQHMKGHGLVDDVERYIDAFEQDLVDQDKELTAETLVGPPSMEPIISAIGLLAMESEDTLRASNLDQLSIHALSAQYYDRKIRAAVQAQS